MLSGLNMKYDFLDLNAACPLDQLHKKFKGEKRFIAPKAYICVCSGRDDCDLSSALPDGGVISCSSLLILSAGSCLLERPATIESLVKAAVASNPSVPVTVKVRTAHYGKQHQLHSFIHRCSNTAS